MATTKFKVESGLQLMTRLRKKPDIRNFYPPFYEQGPYFGEVTELYSSESMSCLLADIISEVLIPESISGKDIGVLIINTDGNLICEVIVNALKNKLVNRTVSSNDIDINELLHKAMKNLHMLDVYDATQFYSTVHNLEYILTENSSISLIMIDTLTAFYWSEQGFKITKMDLYLKNLLQVVQRITKEYKVKVLYTKPEYFSSSKDSIGNLEACSKHPSEGINYRIQVVLQEDGSYQVNVCTFHKRYKKIFHIVNGMIKWI